MKYSIKSFLETLVRKQLDARTISSIICLFESSTCFEELCAHPQEDNCMNTTSGIITLEINEWYVAVFFLLIVMIFFHCFKH